MFTIGDRSQDQVLRYGRSADQLNQDVDLEVVRYREDIASYIKRSGIAVGVVAAGGNLGNRNITTGSGINNAPIAR